ncbi:MAG: 7-carboxy-7-deazaguanine synthase [Oceanococcaceae bacterium]
MTRRRRTYSVHEMHYTLQGEGAQAGHAAVFLRFSGCNLWSGREAQRDRGPGSCARWCDTQFVGTGGIGGGRFGSAEELAAAVTSHWPAAEHQHRLVVCTGGEPLLQLDTALIDALHAADFRIAVETNGTLPAPPGIDWLTVSPKADAPLRQFQGDELKLIFPQAALPPERLASLDFRHFFLQPLDDPARAEHTRAAVAYCQAHPQWRLSLQQHKWLGIP